ncbi:LLM class F420-dependent oxidoreductase [Actinophytocola algeriensis]|uniref:Putative F420-dependent oxidoreductase n=1 Tax=Actinophytocola algeriensis TaxID=1768010 RepID=A0A7W7Q4I7_9PSEU|nr:LLM class F420-dependent oxidoreductase [Actinophytocola algeriensis]MBB4906544.1 putative F420-dependent oxidoreductase [Actinophytocola algeriensis]MBE1478025.1 putative F420-dependent oxidoreductase [Actinophytocola algeriensis]
MSKTLGVWDHAAAPWLRDPAVLAELERLGYETVWLGGSPAADLTSVEPTLAASTSLNVATGIVNVWDGEPDAAAYTRVTEAHPGRFTLGIGVGHPQAVGARYTKPYDKLVSYLDGLDEGGVPVSGRVLAALGPRVLRLAKDRTAGAHPYLTTPEHTAQAREILGEGPLLVPEQKVVLSTDPAEARAIARGVLAMYLKLTNYTNAWLRLGFTEADLADGGSDRLVDALVAWGDADAIRERIAAHWDAGADQVALQVLNQDKMDVVRALGPVPAGTSF